VCLAKSLQLTVGQRDRLQHVEQRLSLLHHRESLSHHRVALLHQGGSGLSTAIDFQLVSDDRRQNRDDHGHTCSDKPESASGHGLSTTCSEGCCTVPPQSRLLQTDLLGAGTLQIDAPCPNRRRPVGQSGYT
jgi:hypothetical protein